MTLPTGRYGAILADPPWRFANYSAAGEDRNPCKHYDCMALADIKALPVADLAADDCALFMWAIDSLLPEALEVMAAWGFTFKTVAFTWAKLSRLVDVKHHPIAPESGSSPFFMGTGYWTRANPEMCLLGTRGAPKRLDCGVRQLIVSRLRQHSRKPDETHARIERLVAGPYVELFAREARPGWATWGNQVHETEADFDATREARALPALPTDQGRLAL